MIAFLFCALLQAPPDLQAGFGAVDITPEIGATIPGSWRPVPAKGVRDPLYAVACVVTDGRTPLALVGVDCIFIGKHTVKQARERIAKNTRIPAANVLVAASHTQTGGPILLCHGVEADPAYQVRVANAVAQAVEDAWAALRPCEIGVGLGKENSISFNRRFLMKDGKEITHPGKPGTPHHSKIVRPAGPVDPDVGVLAVRNSGGSITGVVVTFACHNTVMGGDSFSADYVGALRKHLRAAYGDAAKVVFLNGACGDITQVDNLSRSTDFGPACADRMGSRLAAEAVRTINGMNWMKSLSTGAVTETVPVKIRPESEPAAERPAFGLGSGPEEVFEAERKRVAEERERTPLLDCEVQGLRIGPLGIATNGAGYFAEYGLRIKQASPHALTWFVGVANEYIGYVPTAQAFLGGGYETRTAPSSKLAPDGGQKLLEGALRALHRVQAEEWIPIYACISVPPGESTPERYRELADAGFTMSLTGFPSVAEAIKALDAAKGSGVTLFITCPELKRDTAATVRKLAGHPALAGYHLRDEPSAADFPGLAAWQKTIQGIDPAHPCYINLNPIYAGPQHLGTKTYQEHVDQFVRIVQPPFISFDNYPTSFGKLDPNVFTNLEIISAAARGAGKPFWGFYQSIVWGKMPPRTLAHLRLESFSNLVYGAQCIQAFTYWMPGFPDHRDAPIGLDGRRTRVYDLVKTVNGEIRAWSRVFKDAQVLDVCHAGPALPPGTRPFAAKRGVSGLDVGSGSAVVSFLKKGNGTFVALLNKDIQGTLQLKIRFDDPAKVLDVKKDGVDRPLGGSEFILEPGDMHVFRLP